jgi:hypothetical protein
VEIIERDEERYRWVTKRYPHDLHIYNWRQDHGDVRHHVVGCAHVTPADGREYTTFRPKVVNQDRRELERWARQKNLTVVEHQ